ncbi:F-box/FBD/LRR-repeat protein [Striga hermonthica]|uniref:F-box/FBD/LRR-repeat protein n=1 Tax=Striga hermonthica TaxID=68872 RepID=A0A9N7P1P0_STRHE|nr:F-box/FBD/LRR-repeat protein [Striga hermonthica]
MVLCCKSRLFKLVKPLKFGGGFQKAVKELQMDQLVTRVYRRRKLVSGPSHISRISSSTEPLDRNRIHRSISIKPSRPLIESLNFSMEPMWSRRTWSMTLTSLFFMSDLEGFIDVDRWILFLSRGSVEELILEIWEDPRYKLPSSIYSCHKLIHLELFNCLLKSPPNFNGFTSLKSLDLQHITMDQLAFEHMIVACPLLERLTVMNFDGFTLLNIRAPNLLFIDVESVFEEVSFRDTFHLADVSIGLYIENDTERNVGFGSTGNLIKFFECLPHIQRLEVKNFFLKAREEEEEQSTVTPNPNTTVDNLRTLPFTRLRLIKIVGLSGIRQVLDFVSFLLANAPVLEKMTVKPESMDCERELLKELLRFRRASTFAEIVFLEP